LQNNWWHLESGREVVGNSTWTSGYATSMPLPIGTMLGQVLRPRCGCAKVEKAGHILDGDLACRSPCLKYIGIRLRQAVESTPRRYSTADPAPDDEDQCTHKHLDHRHPLELQEEDPDRKEMRTRRTVGSPEALQNLVVKWIKLYGSFL